MYCHYEYTFRSALATLQKPVNFSIGIHGAHQLPPSLQSKSVVVYAKIDNFQFSVVNPDPHGSEIFCRIRICNSRFQIRVRVRIWNFLKDGSGSVTKSFRSTTLIFIYT
jgi:hypothetical protein